MSGQEKLPPSAYDSDDIKRHYNNFDVQQGRYKFIINCLKPKSKILEIGCFLGRYCDYFKKIGHDPVGVDLSPQVIDEAKKLFPNLDLRCTMGKTLENEFEPHSFDAIVASEVIEHVLHPDDFLASIAKLLKPGGKILLTTQNSLAIHYRILMLIGRYRWDKTHLRLYSKRELIEEFENAGFKILKMKGIPINPKGDRQIPRRVTWLLGRLYPNFCWTWGVEAQFKA